MTNQRKHQLIVETELAIIRCKRENLALWFLAYEGRLKSLKKIKPDDVPVIVMLGDKTKL